MQTTFGQSESSTPNRSRLASDVLPLKASEKKFFEGLFRPIVEKDGSRYVLLGNSNNVIQTDTLIIRPCYDHLLPQIHNCLRCGDDGFFRAVVTGTPGIGKTAFGVYLLRHYVQEKETVLYWEKDKIFLFSFDNEIKDFFGLSEAEVESNGPLYCGTWDTQQTQNWPLFFRADFDIVFIHDPKANDRRVADRQMSINRLVYILSHGHSLISYWVSKGCGPNRFYYMPLWTKSEAESSLKLLKRQATNTPLATWNQEQIEKLYNHFGGCIRGWVQQAEVWGELQAKVLEVVKNSGDNVLAKNTSSRGSIIHMSVDFIEDRPIVNFARGQITSDGQSSDEEAGKHNSFQNYQYIFGSSKLLESFNEALLNAGDESLKLCLQNWAGQSGFESIYGALFELRCHRILEGNQYGDLELRMRVVHSDASKNTEGIYTVSFPSLTGTLRYKSNDPCILNEPTHDNEVEKGVYLWPVSSNHPTYDSAVVVEGKDLGLKEIKETNIGLLLQMTVSGATGLPRLPEHSVKQHIRKKFEEVFKKRIPGYKQSGKAYTAFMVPTECFEPFLFQEEETMKEKSTEKQPEYQLVFGVPNIFTYKKGTPKGSQSLAMEDPFTRARKRCHAYDESQVPRSPVLDKRPRLLQLKLPAKKEKDS